MRLSTYTRIIDVPGERSVILNLPRRNADIVPRSAADELRGVAEREVSPEWRDYALDVGYVTSMRRDEEVAWFRQLVAGMRAGTEPANVMVVTTNSCNLGCSYCFQADSGMRNLLERHLTMVEAEAIMRHVDRLIVERGVAVAELIGGEPLLPRLEDVIEKLVLHFEQNGLSTRVTTNGVFLDRFAHLLGPTRIGDLQISLDGTAATHDQRRIPLSGKPTFAQILANIEIAIDRGSRVMIRPNIDRRNVHDLPALIELLQERGLLDNPLVSLHYVNVHPDPFSADAGVGEHYMTLSEIDEYLSERGHASVGGENLTGANPLGEYLKWVMENPMIDACGAPSRNIYFSPGGQLYNCHELIGRPSEAVGSFTSDKTKELPIWDAWRSRTIDQLANCSECPVAFAHGGGCGARLKQDALTGWGVCDGFPDEFDKRIIALASTVPETGQVLRGGYGTACSA